MALLVLSGMVGSASADTTNADDFLIVNCLLPAQIRQLGQNMTFLAPRKAIRTDAHDCALRGGEFSRGDSGGPAGLQVWLPAAQKGDPEAQTYVGEIFERGLAGAPDYAGAAIWYRRAADQGYARAEIALGALLEQGQGVPRDPAEAAKLFRRAAGLPDALPGDTQAQNARINELNSQLQAVTAADAAKQKQLDAQQRKIDELQRRLDGRQSEVGKDRAALQALQDKLAKARAQEQAGGDAKTQQLNQALADRDRQLASTTGTVADLRAKLAALQGQPADLDRLRNELAAAQDAAAARQRDADQLRAQLQGAKAGQDEKTTQMNQALAERDRALAQSNDAVSQLRAQLDALQNAPPKPTADPAELKRVQADLASAQGAMASQQQDADRLRAQLRAAQAGGAAREKSLGDAVTKLERDVEARQATIAAKDQEIQKLKDQVASLGTAPQERGPAARAAPQPIAFPVAEFGHYHALVIGINNYRRLPPLQSPIADANAVAKVLRDDYGFDVVTLIDANRYQILDALNKFRQSLTDKDNLLIYYAGHGVLDTVNQRGNWLPVDAEPDSTANWISNIQITDILNAMAARQILVVADSCYSGTLTRDVVTAIGQTRNDADRAQWYKIMISKPSRVALTSGGLEPVGDSGGGGHSMFADLFIKALQANSGAVSTQELYQQIEPAVATRMEERNMHQVPEYAPIKMAGHEAGDFVFVRPQAN